MPLINQKKMCASVASGHVSTSPGPTDLCKTPTPGGPVPMPYPNIAPTVVPGPGYTTKTLVMATPMLTKKAKIGLSNGDQPGVALGVTSSKIMGMVEVVMASSDVEAEGGGVARTMDSTNGNI
jgi:hypothetical protein